MSNPLLDYVRVSLPEEVANLLKDRLHDLKQGKFESILRDNRAQILLGHEQHDETKDVVFEDFLSWNDFIIHRLKLLLRHRENDQFFFLVVALAALHAFLQSNVTGPPLDFAPAKLLLPVGIAADLEATSALRRDLIGSLVVDGEAPYKLIPNVELIALAKNIITSLEIAQSTAAGRWARLRVNFVHQRLLTEKSPTLQSSIYADLEELENILNKSHSPSLPSRSHVELILERAAVELHHGFDKRARADLDAAVERTGVKFALTGRLGKRTKFQERDISQLVVLAASAALHFSKGDNAEENNETAVNGLLISESNSGPPRQRQPENLDLNDDTLLEQIAFSRKTDSKVEIQEESAVPAELLALDPSNQPLLDPLDSIILLDLASSITNTSPAHGLTREETLPYASRVLQGGSSNWQIYSQALLIRSRIEGYSSRTMERGLLQLQSLVDQVIAETSGTGHNISHSTEEPKKPTKFLPSQPLEDATVSERLRYVFLLCPPARWELEAELAARWVSLGGLKSALEIYERLEMWPEAALCWAAIEREDKARRIIRRQLFHATQGSDEAADLDREDWQGKPREPAPLDAPRLYCILGDLDQEPAMYEKAWEVSNRRYARAQRSLGRYYFARKDHLKAADAYSKSLKVNQLNHSSWFALGCSLLELEEFVKAAEAFSRAVQLDDSDGEAWSNLAAALLRIDPAKSMPTTSNGEGDLKNESDEAIATPVTASSDPQKHKKDALKALKRAATLSFESFRIWENLLIVAASLRPPAYNDVLAAQKRIIEIRGRTVGERCIDVEVLEMLVQHVISEDPNATSVTDFDATKIRPGLQRMVIEFFEHDVVPLITSSRRLWNLAAKLAAWRKRLDEALNASEKAWRAVIAQPGWEQGTEEQWNEVVEATVELLEAYHTLSNMPRSDGPEGTAGSIATADWKFKAKSAARSILGRGKASWEGTAGWDTLADRLNELKIGDRG